MLQVFPAADAPDKPAPLEYFEKTVYFATDRDFKGHPVDDDSAHFDTHLAYGKGQQNDVEYGRVTVTIPRNTVTWLRRHEKVRPIIADVIVKECHSASSDHL